MSMPLDRERSTSQPANRRGCAGCLPLVLGLSFTGFGVVGLYFMLLQPLLSMWRAQGWEPTQCTVISSDLKSGGGDGDTARIEVVYRYMYGGADHQSNRYCFAEISSNTSSTWKRAVIKDHPPGKVTQCYVNPRNPAEAVIDRGWVPEMWWGLFPLPFLGVGIGVLVFAPALVRSAMKRRDGSSNWQPEVTAASSSPALYGDFRSAGLVTLKPDTTPLMGFLAAIFICLFWNGIVSVFVWQAIEGFRRGPRFGDWVLALFITPFALIGLGIIVAVFYSFLTLFNPRPTLTVNSVSLPVGGTLQVRWNLSGRVHSISQFKILLRGVEKAEYMRGTSRHTDKQMFAEITIFETTDTLRMIEGEAKLEIPSRTMHSFNADHNKIEWSLGLSGDISFWPNLAASFPIVLLPRAVASQP